LICCKWKKNVKRGKKNRKGTQEDKKKGVRRKKVKGSTERGKNSSNEWSLQEKYGTGVHCLECRKFCVFASLENRPVLMSLSEKSVKRGHTNKIFMLK
jgi:hypothetical protein